MKQGFALIAATIITALILLLGIFFVSGSLSEIRIAQAHGATVRAYYLAETARMLLTHELEETGELQTAFVEGTLTEASSQRQYLDVFRIGETLVAHAVSSAPGEATLISQGQTPLAETSATRRIETAVARALGSAITDYSVFSGAPGRDIELELDLDLVGGILFSNDDIDVRNNARVQARTNGRFHAHDEIRVSEGSALIGPTRTGVDQIQLPAVDFNSALATSWRNQATQRITPHEFNRLPSGTILEGIIYLEGAPNDLRRDLTVRGLLVINGSFEIEQPGHLYIEAPETGPAGLLVRGDLEIENSSSLEGLVYATNTLEIEFDDDDTAAPLEVSVRGGLMAREIELERDQEGSVSIIITHDPALLRRILNADLNLSSPIIETSHWEEQY
ncbi:hypothetical protein HYW17_01110 [Candidatus Uhrbacteria bacterium]|nr:hypothetical protein [Candidatus Uhrbacteria bacterium]